MYKAVRNNIYITRGDSAYLQLIPKTSDGKFYELQPGDSVTVTVKKSTADESEPLLVRQSDENGVIHIMAGETSDWDFGDYVYDAQLRTNRGDVITFITPHLFRVMEEVTVL